MTTEPLDLPEHRKARGAFFTPPEVSNFAAQWAIRSPLDDVLEPSCGEAVFLTSAARRFRELGSRSPRLDGYELHEPSARRAVAILDALGIGRHDIRTGDFLTAPIDHQYAAVVGNPPYIRYQGFTGASREAGRVAALAQGVELTNLASSWAPFVVHSAAFVRPDGRLALVLPAELLSSNYAADIRRFLMTRFADLKVVLFDGQVFPGVQTEAVLLLAQGTGGTETIEFGRVSRLDQLDDLEFDTTLRPHHRDAKWTTALVNTAATSTLASLTNHGSFVPLETWGRVNLGAVTGANAFFTMSPERTSELGLDAGELIRISPPGSTHLRELTLSRRRYETLGGQGARTVLFRPVNPSPAAQAYIAQGERDGVNEAFKCRVRKPWWQVPVLPAPDLFFTYMNADTAQLCANPLRLRHLNSIHGVYLEADHRNHASLLALAALNSATMLSAETVGRAYGGGILKMEPREAAQLAVPAPDVLTRLAPDLQRISRRVGAALHKRDLAAAVTLVDSVLLQHGLAVPSERIHEVRRGRNLLAHRRKARARKSAPKELTGDGKGAR